MIKTKMPERDVSRIESYFYCPVSYFLDQIVKESGLPITGFFARYFRQKDSISGLFPKPWYEKFVGPDLDHIEWLSGEKLAKYLGNHSAKAFASEVVRNWNEYIVNANGKVHERDVAWYPGQWINEAKLLRRSCLNYYKFIQKEGPPILAYENKLVAFVHKGIKYDVRFNSVRKGLVVCKYSSSKKTQEDLDDDFTITMKLLAFCTLAHDEGAYRLVWGVDPKMAKTWGGVEHYIGPEVAFIYYNLSEGTKLETRRSDADIPKTLQAIETMQQGIDSKDFRKQSAKKKCGACKYNVRDLFDRPVCPGRKDGVRYLEKFDITPIYIPDHKTRKTKKKSAAKKSSVKKEPSNQLDLF